MMGLNRTRNAVFGSGPGVNFKVPVDGPVIGPAAVVSGIALFGTNAGSLYAVSAQRGRVLWHVNLGNMVMSTPIVSGGRVFVGIGNNSMEQQYGASWVRGTGRSGLAALQLTSGKVLWEVHTQGAVMGGAVLYHGRLYFADGSNHLYAVDPATGHVLFRVTDGGVDSMSAPVAAKGAIWVVTGGPAPAQLRAFSAKTGKLLRQDSGGANSDDSPTINRQMAFEVYGAPFTSGGRSWLTDVLAAFSVKGKPLWTFSMQPGVAPPTGNPPGTAILACYLPFETPPVTAHAGTLFFGSRSAPVAYAVQEKTGKPLWKAQLPGPTEANPVINKGAAYFTTTNGHLVALSTRTGAQLGNLKVGGGFGPAYPTLVNGSLYVGNINHRFYAVATSRVRNAGKKS